MKGNAKVIEQLNIRLAEELTAINQYFVHAEMCENWKFGPHLRHHQEEGDHGDETRGKAYRAAPFS